MSRRRPDPTTPVDLDALFHTPVEGTNMPPPLSAPVVTGLSDEEDAQRHLALRFNRDLFNCPNCEVDYDLPDDGSLDEKFWDCPRCGGPLYLPGTVKPYRRKHTK